MPVAPPSVSSENWKIMHSRDDSGFDPARGQPESENAFADSGGPAAEDDYQVADSGVGGEALTELQRRLNEQQEKYLRLAAEYENYRKRSMRERSETYSKAQADLVKQLLDALDDLARFAHVDPA